MEKLAIHGGPQVFEYQIKEQWKRPKEVEKQLISTLIDWDHPFGSGKGIGRDFEQAFASYTGCKYCLTFDHGTSAITAAYYAFGVGPGDEVLTPALGYIASYSGAMHMGARPVFCDIDPSTILIDPQAIKKNITPKTKAISLIHINGRVCDLDGVREVAGKHGLPIIEDASHAHGAEWDKKKIGNTDHIACFSLQGANPTGKPVGGGEGGVACTNDKALYQRMLIYSQLHRNHILEDLQDSPYGKLDKEVLGLKCVAHPFAMALALISLKSLDERNNKIAQNYLKTLDIIKNFKFLTIPKTYSKAKMGGFFRGFKFIYEPQNLNNIPLRYFVEILEKEGFEMLQINKGTLEYRRSIFQKGFDLWGRGRGPINGPWGGLEQYIPYPVTDFPHAESLKNRILTLPAYIEVDDTYFVGLQKVLEKIEFNLKAV